MNKLDLSNRGGDPLCLDDLEFLQNALAEGVKGLASFWNYIGDDPVIISGLKSSIVGSDTVYTSGYIIVNSEVYFVDGGTFAIAPICIDIGQTIDTNGDEVFEDLSAHSTYLIRKGMLSPASGANSVDLVDFLTVKNVLANKGAVVDNSTAWTPFPSLGAGFSEITFDYEATTARYRKNKLGDVEFRGMIQSVNVNGLLCTLPVGFRPVQPYVSSVHIRFLSGGTAEPKQILIKTNGEVYVNTDSVSATQHFSIDSVRFPTS